MFTGLVEEVGTIAALVGDADGVRLTIDAAVVIADLAPGDSVSVDGACLTAVQVTERGFAVDVVAETLRRTAVGGRSVGDRVNLERAVRAGDRLGGHLVQGHVDGVGTVADVAAEGEGRRVAIEVPDSLARYIVEKGSITVDGVSLTVAAAGRGRFEIALIPHTLGHTTLGELAPGRPVNLEVDLVAKYVESLVAPYTPSEGTR